MHGRRPAVIVPGRYVLAIDTRAQLFQIIPGQIDCVRRLLCRQHAGYDRVAMLVQIGHSLGRARRKARHARIDRCQRTRICGFKIGAVLPDFGLGFAERHDGSPSVLGRLRRMNGQSMPEVTQANPSLGGDQSPPDFTTKITKSTKASGRLMQSVRLAGWTGARTRADSSHCEFVEMPPRLRSLVPLAILVVKTGAHTWTTDAASTSRAARLACLS